MFTRGNIAINFIQELVKLEFSLFKLETVYWVVPFII